MPHGFSGELPPSQFNMAEYCLASSAANTPDKTGLIVLGREENNPVTEAWTFADLEVAVARTAGSLVNAGLSSGDRLMIRLGNTSDYAITFFGAIAAGIVAIPTSSQLTEREADIIANDARISAVAGTPPDIKGIQVFSEEDVRSMWSGGPVAEYGDTACDDPAFLIYTSGTTGQPKGVLHAHRSAWGRRPMYRDWYGITQEDRLLHAGAFNWTYTLGTGLTDPWANGATAIINTQPRDPSSWPSLICKTGATIFAAVPSLYRQILKYAPPGPVDVGPLRHGLTAGETLPTSVAKEWFDRTGTRLHEALGMSEMSTYISACPDHPAKPGTIGRVQSNRSVAILPTEGNPEPLAANEIGLLAVHRTDPGLMLGYWKRPDETESVFRGDWFCGGDLASIDEEGYLTHHGRADDLMNAFGYRVSPKEVEQNLAGTPGVSEIAVTDIEVREGVSIIAAFVVATDDADDSLRRHLDKSATERLAQYKRPRDYFMVDTLPRTANGKIRRADLQAVYDNRNFST